ncbi:tyrosine-type recombinase/integrase [Rhizobium sp. GN54]|uniref:tyrosine-type recombinase/integrase n=1 Tax=Rhizobium sp. GN54 TaxID=2898150 RepID=UPI001E3F0D0F|nr:tyrosine-type recombinase/integrase [Rhizobium sp. GN54]MCD2183590.1 tyrosine-type recombinase/integrase [Rhizobium sp. GN54]
MLNPAYLAKSKNGIFYLRWPIPKQLHPLSKATTLKLSLRTRNPKNALRLSRPLIQIGERLNQDGIVGCMRYEALRALLTEHFRNLLEQQKAEIQAEGRLSAFRRDVIAGSKSTAELALQEDKPLQFWERNDNKLLSAFIEKYAADVPEGSKQYAWLQRDIKSAYLSYLDAVLAYDDSLARFNLEPRTGISSPLPSQGLKEKGMTIAELASSYVKEKELGENWVARTKMEKADHIKLLQEILGEQTDIRSITAKETKQVKDTLKAYPKNRSKNRETRGKPLEAVLKMQDVERIQPPTINKYLQTYNDMFEWARRNSHVNANLFSGLAIRQNRKRSQIERTAFTNEQVRTILNTVVENSAGLIRKEYQKWGPLIGLYTGARLNEIAQIDLTDIRQQDGVWLFDLNDDGEGKQLKTAAARRLVPIHHRLIELGLLEHVAELRKQGKHKLFPDFPNSIEHGRGRNLGRWFNEKLLPELNIKSKELVFHSLRHTVVTRLMQANVPEPIVKAIVGHQQQGVTQQNYFKQGYTVQQLDSALQKLDFH